MMTPYPYPSSSRRLLFTRRKLAFNLIELLVVITIIGVLGAIIMAGVRGVMMSARKAECVSTLRGYGVAILAYATDNKTLPGPLWGGQSPKYTQDANHLCSRLWPYFQDVEPEVGTFPEWQTTSHYREWYQEQPEGSKVSYYMAGPVEMADGTRVRPFGLYSHNDESRIDAVNWNQFRISVDLNSTVVMSEAFATASAPSRAPQAGDTQNYKATLYFDGHVETISL